MDENIEALTPTNLYQCLLDMKNMRKQHYAALLSSATAATVSLNCTRNAFKVRRQRCYLNEKMNTFKMSGKKYEQLDEEAGVAAIRGEIVCALGLVPFFVWFILTGSLVSLVVTLNGVIFHVFFPDSFSVKAWDIACNAVLIVLINLFARDVHVVALTVAAVM